MLGFSLPGILGYQTGMQALRMSGLVAAGCGQVTIARQTS